MLLKLKNIRQHLDRTIKIPDQGIVKLSARSGVGKSTVMDAIRHALLGDVDDMVHWDQDSGSIYMEWRGIEVTRTMRPNTLLVVDQTGTQYKDDVAQTFIHQWLGMNAEEMLASSFIQQGMADSLLNLKPAEQLRFIQRLAFGADDPEVTKKKIAGLIGSRKTPVAIKEQELQDLELKIATAEGLVKSLQDQMPPEPPAGLSQPEISALRVQLGEANQAAKDAKVEIQRDAAALKDTIYREVESLEQAERQHRDNVAEINRSIALQHNQLAAAPKLWPSGSREESEARVTEIVSGIRYATILAEAKVKSAEIKAEFKIDGAPLEALKSMLELAIDTGEVLAANIRTASDEIRAIESLPAAQNCPDCGVSLMVKDRMIVRHAHVYKDERLAQLNETVGSSQKEKARVEKTRSKVQAAISTLEGLKAKLSTYKKASFESQEVGEAELKELQAYISQNRQLENQVGTILAKIDALGKTLKDSTTRHLAYVESVKNRLAKTEPVGVIQARMEENERLVAHNLSLAEGINNQLEADRSQMFVRSDYALKKQKLELAHQNLQDLNLKITEVGIAAKAARTDLQAAMRLKELSDRASMEAIDQIMAGINVNSKHYVDAVFPEDGTSVQLMNKKVNSDGEERPKPSLRVAHKGSNPKTTNSFSGGERMRLTLAFQLGLADMYHSPLMMIDEALAWLDLDNKTLCIEALRPAATDKLIIIVEHGLPDSMVDHVITL